MKFLPYHDKSVFSFGKHKGEFFQDIPSEYFKWMWETFDHEDERNEPIIDYIKRNRKSIEQDVGELV